MINPASSSRHKWILTTTDYFTRWLEVVLLKNAIEKEILNFLEDLVACFGPPKTIISDNTRAFLGSKISDFAFNNKIFLKASSNYYPQGNGLAKSTNKNLIRLIKRIGADHQR